MERIEIMTQFVSDREAPVAMPQRRVLTSYRQDSFGLLPDGLEAGADVAAEPFIIRRWRGGRLGGEQFTDSGEARREYSAGEN
jgi:hypothetical protein